jgi:hypothetical protein
MIEVSATKFEGYEGGDGVFTVECFDEAAAKVIITDLLNVARWDEIAPLIRQCLVDMRLEGDIK